jgi:hypothetical protein
MRPLTVAFTVLLAWVTPSPAQDVRPTSVYTDLSGKNCRQVTAIGETGASVHRCRGVGDYALLVLDDDDRMSLTLIAPDRREHPLDFWTIVTTSFSTLGPKAEWRVVKKDGRTVPVALIVRVNANVQENPDRAKKVSYLVVTKITAGEVCVTDRIDSSPEANVKARQLADASAQKDCLKR